MRGLAALSVAFAHSTAVFTISGNADYWNAKPLEADFWVAVFKVLHSLVGVHVAVLLFFVLSGFVLTKSLARRPVSWALYPVRRAVRLMPALIVSVLACWLVVNLLYLPPGPENSVWFKGIFPAPFSFSDVAWNILLQNSTVNNVTWTISTELVASSLLPLLFLATRRVKIEWIVLALAVMTIYGRFQVAQYGYCFALGALLAMKPNRPFPALLPIAAIAVIWAVPFTDIFGAYRSVALITACGVLIYWVDLNRPTYLRSRSVVALGRVSYSFYLIHPAALYAASTSLIRLGIKDVTGNILAFVLSSVLAYFAAKVLFSLVEEPSIAWSRSIGDRRVSQSSDAESN